MKAFDQYDPAKPDYLPLYAAIDSLPEKPRVTVVLFYFSCWV